MTHPDGKGIRTQHQQLRPSFKPFTSHPFHHHQPVRAVRHRLHHNAAAAPAPVAAADAPADSNPGSRQGPQQSSSSRDKPAQFETSTIMISTGKSKLAKAAGAVTKAITDSKTIRVIACAADAVVLAVSALELSDIMLRQNISHMLVLQPSRPSKQLQQQMNLPDDAMVFWCQKLLAGNATACCPQPSTIPAMCIQVIAWTLITLAI